MTDVKSFLRQEQLQSFFYFEKEKIESILSLNLHNVDITGGVDKVTSDIVEIFFENNGRYMIQITNNLDKLNPYIKILLYDELIEKKGVFYSLTSKGIKFYLENKYDKPVSYYYSYIIEKLQDVQEISGEDFRNNVPKIFSNNIYGYLVELMELGLIDLYVDASQDYLIRVK